MVVSMTGSGQRSEEEVPLYTRQRMGFFGFAIGVALYFLMVIIINLIPALSDLVIAYFPRYEFPWNYVMLFLTPIMWGCVLFFVPYNKSKF